MSSDVNDDSGNNNDNVPVVQIHTANAVHLLLVQ